MGFGREEEGRKGGGGGGLERLERRGSKVITVIGALMYVN